MNVTEEEAKTKWCHRAMGFADRNAGNNPYAEKCVASMCMAWRWVGKQPIGDYVPNEWRNKTGVLPYTKGFCGLAGKIEP